MPYINIFAKTNNNIMPTFTPPLYNYSIPSLFSQLNTFNNYTGKLVEYTKNNNLYILTTKNKETRSINININRNTVPIEIDRNFNNPNKLDINFLNRVKQIANKLNCDYKDLLALMNSESGIRTNAWNGTTAVGLIQFTNASISELNQKQQKQKKKKNTDLI